MQEKVDSKAELNQWPFTETPAAFNVAMKLILSLARNESFIVSSERFERVVGFANGGYADSSIGEGSVEIQCEKMRSVEMANGGRRLAPIDGDHARNLSMPAAICCG
jgi:hypothetical protein